MTESDRTVDTIDPIAVREDVRMTAKTGALKTPTGDEPKDWQCLTCQYVVVSPTLPYKCPRCGASRVKFVIKGESGEGE